MYGWQGKSFRFLLIFARALNVQCSCVGAFYFCLFTFQPLTILDTIWTWSQTNSVFELFALEPGALCVHKRKPIASLSSSSSSSRQPICTINHNSSNCSFQLVFRRHPHSLWPRGRYIIVRRPMLATLLDSMIPAFPAEISVCLCCATAVAPLTVWHYYRQIMCTKRKCMSQFVRQAGCQCAYPVTGSCKMFTYAWHTTDPLLNATIVLCVWHSRVAKRVRRTLL